MNPSLPIHEILAELRHRLGSCRSAILSAPPGSGKTTVVPLELLNEPWLKANSILVLEPRRLAARLAAGFMAKQLGEEAGGTVGYRVRFDTKVSKQTRVEVITEGVFTRRLQRDPELTGVGLVIFDEFHERSLESDLALALCLDVMNGLRDDLRLLVMSATLDTAPLHRLLGDAPVITGQGTMYPVEVSHLAPPPHLADNRADHIAINTAAAVRQALIEQPGDLLVFLPGAGEIRQTEKLLTPLTKDNPLTILPLYGDLSTAAQDRAVRPDPQSKRRVILATTIAETSITIEGVTVVIDCGWKRAPRFDPNSGFTRLETVRISRASAHQRLGRAGRLGPGFCYRLWSEGVEHGLQSFDRPEIVEADLAPLALELASWGVSDSGQLQWLDPPPRGAYDQARGLLENLKALDSKGNITGTGKKMADLPVHPRLAHMLVKARNLGCAELAADLAGLLSERDILRGRERSSDIEERLHVLEVFRKEGAAAVRALGGDLGGCRRIDQVSHQLTRLLRSSRSLQNRLELSAGALLALAFPDRVARQRPGTPHAYKLAAGRGATLPSHDPLNRSEFLAAASLDAGKREGRIFLAASLSKDEIIDLFSDQLQETDEITWDEKTGAISARRQTKLGALVLAQARLPNPALEDMKAVLLATIREKGLAMLPWSDAARSLQARLICLRNWRPETDWPDFSDEQLLATLADWLGPYLDKIRTQDQLNRINLEEILKSRLDWHQQQQLDQDVPTHLQAPSGSRIRLKYTVGEPPILAVRLQEMFGLANTPTICQGRVPVLLHLLSPARRPIQITSDLEGFWNGSYHEVKKELKGRYPKHHWPDDPWNAAPTARVKPKR